MTTTTIDYTEIDDTLNGTAYQTALRTQFQNAEADMVKKPNVADAETITGAWTHSANITLKNGTASTPDLIIEDDLNNTKTFLTMNSEEFIVYVSYQGGGVVRGMTIDNNTTEATFPKLIGTTFCMGGVTTPVGTYGTSVDATSGMSLSNTHVEIDKIISALAAVGIISES